MTVTYSNPILKRQLIAGFSIVLTLVHFIIFIAHIQGRNNSLFYGWTLSLVWPNSYHSIDSVTSSFLAEESVPKPASCWSCSHSTNFMCICLTWQATVILSFNSFVMLNLALFSALLFRDEDHCAKEDDGYYNEEACMKFKIWESGIWILFLSQVLSCNWFA